MKPFWSSELEVDGARWQLARNELQRIEKEKPRRAEFLAQEIGGESAPPSKSPTPAQKQTTPPPAKEAPPKEECKSEGCAQAFESASENGSPMVQRGGENC